MLYLDSSHNYARGRLLFNANYIFSVYVEHLSVLVVFGYTFPYLAIVVTASLCAQTTQWRVLFSRYLYYKSNNISVAVKELEKSCANVPRLSFTVFGYLVSLISALLTFFLVFDVAYDNPNVTTSTLIIYFAVFVTTILACFGAQKLLLVRLDRSMPKMGLSVSLLREHDVIMFISY